MRPSRLPEFLPVLCLVATLLLAPAARASVDCGCSTTGAFVNPAESVAPSVTGGGYSPHGTYQVVIQSSYPGWLIEVYKAGAGQPILTTYTGLDGAWGFSPDDDRFMVHYRITANTNDFQVLVYDLTDPQLPFTSQALFTDAINTGSAFYGFSPQGNWIVESWLQPPAPNEAHLKVASTKTGLLAYSAGFSFSQAPGGGTIEEVGVAGFGFAPDAGERSLSYVYNDVTNIVRLELVNVPRGSSVASLAPNASWSSSSYWQFSPCGDAFAVGSLPFGTATHVDLYRTRDGSRPSPGQAEVAGVWSIATNASATAWTTTMNATGFALGTNTAGDACPSYPVIQSLTLNPASVIAGGASTGTVTFVGNSAVEFALGVGVSNPSRASVTSNATVRAGDHTTSFSLATQNVGDSSPLDVTVTVQVPGGTSVPQVLTIQPAPHQLVSFGFQPNLPVLGGVTNTLGFQIDFPAGPGGELVTLTNPRPDLVTLPDTLRVAEGSPSASLDIVPTPVAAPDSVTLVASLNGSSKSFLLRLRPPELSDLSALQTCISPPDQVPVRATLEALAPAGGMVVHLASNDPAATPPATATVPAGATSVEFLVDATVVSTNHRVTITGSTTTVVQAAHFTLLNSSAHVRVRMLDMVAGFDPSWYDTGNEVAGINARGDIVGTQDGYTQQAYSEGAAWLGNVPQLCDGRGNHGFWGSVYGYGINIHRQSVGGGAAGPWTADSTGGLLWLVDPNSLRNLTGQATCINDAGRIGGGSDESGRSDPNAWLLQASDTLVTLPLEPDGKYAWFTAINNQDLAVGIEADTTWASHPFVWDRVHGKQMLPLPNASATGAALCVDERGRISGWVAPNGAGASTYPATWLDGQLVRVENGTGAFDRTSPAGLLSAGWRLFGSTQEFPLPDISDCDIANPYVWGVDDAGRMAVSGRYAACGHWGCRTTNRAFLVASLPGAPWLDANVPVLDAAAVIEDLESSRVKLRWAVSGLPPATATVQRWTIAAGWSSVGVPRAERDAYTFADSTVDPGTHYAYRLAVLQDGQALHVGYVELTTPRGAELAMLGFFPNPSRDGEPSVAFTVPDGRETKLELLDIGGRRVAERRFVGLTPGAHRWEVGRETRLAPGIYLARATQGGLSRTTRVTLLR